MKKYIKAASRTLLFPYEGSGSAANARAGKVNFGKGKEIRLRNGGKFYPVTAKTYFDSVIGEVVTSVNIMITLDLDQPYMYEGEDGTTSHLYQEFMNYTPQECSQVYDAVSNMTTEELCDFLASYAEKRQAYWRKRSLHSAEEGIKREHPEIWQEDYDKYAGKIDDEGYWLE